MFHIQQYCDICHSLLLLTLSYTGKHASGTRNRRLVWSELVWPLVVDLESSTFTPEQYRAKRNELCRTHNVTINEISRGLVSLIHKGLIIREGKVYSLNHKLIPYVRVGLECDYTRALYVMKLK